MKKQLLYVFACLIGLSVWGCKKSEEPNKKTPTEEPRKPIVQSITLEPKQKVLHVGETTKLNVAIKPETLSQVELLWRSHNTEVASVSDQGVITALKEGETTIEVQVKGHKGISASCRLVVEPKSNETPPPTPKTPIAVQAVSLNETDIELHQGNTYRLLRASVLPTNADNKEIDWSSNQSDIASVSEQGHITALQVGEAIISATSRDGGHRATCRVRVLPAKHEPSPNDVRVTGVSVELEPNEIQVGRELQMRAVVFPKNATNQNVTWSLSNPSVATISPTGLIRATKVGSTKIIVRTIDGGHVWTSREVRITRFEFREGDSYRNLVGVVDTQGKPTSLKQFVDQGHYILLDFWGSWCGPCRWAMPRIKQIWDKYRDNGLIVIGVACGDRLAAHQEAVKSLGITWPQIVDTENAWAPSLTYDIKAFPTLGLLDPQGKVVSWYITPAEADNILQSILNERGRL